MSAKSSKSDSHAVVAGSGSTKPKEREEQQSAARIRRWWQRRSYERSMREYDRIRDWFLRVQKEHDRGR